MDRRIKNISGQRFGRLVASEYVESLKNRGAMWSCLCDCGATVVVSGMNMRLGLTKSCGCLNDEVRRIVHVTPEHRAARRKKNWDDWYAKNKDAIREKAARYARNNPVKIKESRKRRQAERMATDVNYRITKNLRGRLCTAIKRQYKTGSAISDLGCSIPELRAHLESKFHARSDGTAMSWDNYGKTGWVIDHIRPLFLLSDGVPLTELCHFSNLQPLWCEDNLSKRDADMAEHGRWRTIS